MVYVVCCKGKHLLANWLLNILLAGGGQATPQHTPRFMLARSHSNKKLPMKISRRLCRIRLRSYSYIHKGKLLYASTLKV